MRNLFKVFGFFILLFISGSLSAQVNAKLGYINSSDLLDLMPGKDSIEVQLKNYQQSLESTIQGMIQEYQSKIQDYQANSAAMSQIIRQTKEKEIQDLETRIQSFQQNAEADFQQKQAELFDPLIARARKAIEEVARENGYTYIFDTSVGVVLFYEKGDNILPLVKAKLGLK